MSSVTLAELEDSLHRKGQPDRLKTALFQVLLRVDVLPWSEAAARCYGAAFRAFRSMRWSTSPRTSVSGCMLSWKRLERYKKGCFGLFSGVS